MQVSRIAKNSQTLYKNCKIDIFSVEIVRLDKRRRQLNLGSDGDHPHPTPVERRKRCEIYPKLTIKTSLTSFWYLYC